MSEMRTAAIGSGPVGCSTGRRRRMRRSVGHRALLRSPGRHCRKPSGRRAAGHSPKLGAGAAWRGAPAPTLTRRGTGRPATEATRVQQERLRPDSAVSCALAASWANCAASADMTSGFNR